MRLVVNAHSLVDDLSQLKEERYIEGNVYDVIIVENLC